ncbi:ArsR family transcriptional regulator [Haloferax sp. S1W]|uniref:ArsR family transcriptional regulator n=1 Tax=Haloferax sp. S1W TaxID=3377110 RepID=UPI0037C7C2D3
MKLVEPTDFAILEYLDSNGRNNAVNIGVALDQKRAYMNTRLRALDDFGCVTRVGPAKNSGLYEITAKGRAALDYRDAQHDPDVDFEQLISTAAQSDEDSSYDHV